MKHPLSFSFICLQGYILNIYSKFGGSGGGIKLSICTIPIYHCMSRFLKSLPNWLTVSEETSDNRQEETAEVGTIRLID